MQSKIPLKTTYLEKLWTTVFANRNCGLVNPLVWSSGKKPGVEKARIKQRANELVQLKQIEREIADIRAGRKAVTDSGRLEEVVFRYDRDAISVPAIIERTEDEADDRQPGLNFQKIYLEAKQERNLSQVENMLVMMRIYIFAEAKANLVPPEIVSHVPVGRQWFARWWEAAKEAHSESLQLMWAKILGREVTKPGTFPLRSIQFMRGVSDADAEVIRIVSRFSFGDYIFKEAGHYFSPELHEPMFERLEEWGLIRGKLIGEYIETVKSSEDESFSAVLKCQNKALYIHADDHDIPLSFQVYRITELGRAVFSLGTGDADMGYLWAVSTEIKEHGFDVTLGDWLEQGEGHAGLMKAKLEVR